MKQDTIQNVTNVLEDVNIINIINEFLIIVLLIVVVVFVLYCLRDKYVLIYNKIILKMGDFEKSYRKAKDFFESNNLKDAMLIVGDTLKCHNLPPEWKYQFDKLKSDIYICNERIKIEKNIDNLLNGYKFIEAEQLVETVKKESYIDESFELSLYNKITEAHINFIKLQIDNSIEKNKILETINAIKDLCERFGREEHIKDYIEDLAKNKLSLSTSEFDIESIKELIKKVETIPLLCETHFLDDLKTKLNEEIYKKAETDIDKALRISELNEVKEFINSFSTKLTSQQKENLKDKIINSRAYRLHTLKQKIEPLIEKGKFHDAEKIINEAKNNNSDIFSELDETIDKAKLKNKQEIIKNVFKEIDDKIKDYNLSDDDISNLNEKMNEDSRLWETFGEYYVNLLKRYNDTKEAIKKEDSYFGTYPIINLGGFNVPKIKDEGEDAEPLIDVNKNRCWGIISVFDGLGGAGGVEYTHNQSNEKHKGAYWASRFVRESIEKLIQNRQKGEDPLEYLEKNIHSFIINHLNEKVKEFTIADSDVKAKDMDFVFPTTMALCAYKFEDHKLIINCYWAGDSRIYMFDGHKFVFLTIDDSEAGGDPFSTVNADLPMNNKICQNKNFHINKSVHIHELQNDTQIALIATTDGCYGYYLNPIEFEYMLLSSLIDENSNKYMERIKQSVIDNGQQDDLSMAMIIISGDKNECSMDGIKELAYKRLSNSIFSDYLNWRRKQKDDKNELEKKLVNLGNTVKYKRDLGAYSREFIGEAKSYLSKISILNDGTVDIGIEEIQEKIRELVNNELKSLVTDEYLSSEKDSYRNCKNDISAFNLSSKKENECWYQKYKKTIEIINNENIRQIC